jgi:hypothetical protein
MLRSFQEVIRLNGRARNPLGSMPFESSDTARSTSGPKDLAFAPRGRRLHSPPAVGDSPPRCLGVGRTVPGGGGVAFLSA